MTYYLRSLLIHEFVQTKLLGTEGGDSSGKSIRLETPQRAFFASEEAQAMPAESVRLQWKVTVALAAIPNKKGSDLISISNPYF
ncbi:hypothetical protein [Virgibacillus chiguensis]|uniref:hypothetical protein n=1 Tax=Virgibacillus chiguensis TaxID=411959 RepID=UPI001BB00200|nr:hypothetical protein [Virgibacillus chiguensis]